MNIGIGRNVLTAGLLVSVLLLIVAGWLAVVLCFLFLSCCVAALSLLSLSFSFSLIHLFFFTANSLVCWRAYFCFVSACSLRLALHGQIT